MSHSIPELVKRLALADTAHDELSVELAKLVILDEVTARIIATLKEVEEEYLRYGGDPASFCDVMSRAMKLIAAWLDEQTS